MTCFPLLPVFSVLQFPPLSLLLITRPNHNSLCLSTMISSKEAVAMTSSFHSFHLRGMHKSRLLHHTSKELETTVAPSMSNKAILSRLSWPSVLLPSCSQSIFRTSLPRCLCEIDACHPSLCLLMPSYQKCLCDVFLPPVLRLQYWDLVGGALALTPEQVVKTNGYSNVYWGWGGEDDDMFLRYMLPELV